MKKAMLTVSIAVCFVLTFSYASYGAVMYADHVTNIIRGTVPGNFAGFYGGSFPGSYPVSLTPSEAGAAVLGAPDSNFLSLPGGVVDTTPAYVEVGFATNFLADHLYITELGANQESALIFVWFANGGNVQPSVTRNGTDTLDIDLSPYAALMNANGGSFSKVGIMGKDQLGASWGFDLDAIGVTAAAVPEPTTMLLLGFGLIGLAGARRRMSK
jgi:hypothetical protein